VPGRTPPWRSCPSQVGAPCLRGCLAACWPALPAPLAAPATSSSCSQAAACRAPPPSSKPIATLALPPCGTRHRTGTRATCTRPAAPPPPYPPPAPATPPPFLPPPPPTGYDIEDAIVINKASLDRGFGRCIVIKKYNAVLRKYANRTQDRVVGPPLQPGQARPGGRCARRRRGLGWGRGSCCLAGAGRAATRAARILAGACHGPQATSLGQGCRRRTHQKGSCSLPWPEPLLPTRLPRAQAPPAGQGRAGLGGLLHRPGRRVHQPAAAHQHAVGAQTSPCSELRRAGRCSGAPGGPPPASRVNTAARAIAACGPRTWPVRLLPWPRRGCSWPWAGGRPAAPAAAALSNAPRPRRRDPVAGGQLPDSCFKPTPMSWKHTPSMVGP
jgi:hypothetical protein